MCNASQRTTTRGHTPGPRVTAQHTTTAHGAAWGGGGARRGRGPAGGSVRPALKGNAADKYKALIISAEKGKARKEAVERQRSFAAALDDEAIRSECPTPEPWFLPASLRRLAEPRAALSRYDDKVRQEQDRKSRRGRARPAHAAFCRWDCIACAHAPASPSALRRQLMPVCGLARWRLDDGIARAVALRVFCVCKLRCAAFSRSPIASPLLSVKGRRAAAHVGRGALCLTCCRREGSQRVR